MRYLLRCFFFWCVIFGLSHGDYYTTSLPPAVRDARMGTPRAYMARWGSYSNGSVCGYARVAQVVRLRARFLVWWGGVFARFT